MSALQQADRQQAARISPIVDYLTGLLERFTPLDDGAVASYIPELARSNPADFGICIVTLDGAVYEVGDTRVPFTIQSMSKPLTYGLALERLGDESVAPPRRRGAERRPVQRDQPRPRDRRAREPHDQRRGDRLRRDGGGARRAARSPCCSTPYSSYAGRALELDEAVYLSERATGHRNRAIAHLLGSFELLDVTPEDAVDLYFRQCAISVDCRDLALIASTLANGGINPVSRERAVGEDVVRGVLSVMTTCGMYDAAGDWLMSVGLPAKSGVSGGVFARPPRAPRDRRVLTERSTSAATASAGSPSVARSRRTSRFISSGPESERHRRSEPSTSSARIRSKRVRSPEQREAILAGSTLTQIFELQGELGFMAAEAISRRMTEARVQPELIVVDLRRVARADRGGVDFLTTLRRVARRFRRRACALGCRRRARARAFRHAARLRRARRGPRVVRGRAARPGRLRGGTPAGSRSSDMSCSRHSRTASSTCSRRHSAPSSSLPGR